MAKTSKSMTAFVGARTRERRWEELSETLSNLKLDHRNPDLWIQAASLCRALGNLERAFRCTRASIKVEAERKEEARVSIPLADQLQRELTPHETVPCPNCYTLLVLGRGSCHVCGLELHG